MASSPPFFCGSPPSRASNPVIQDEQFGSNGNENFGAFSLAPPSPSSSARGCVRMKFGHTPAAVRIEGFNCLSRERRLMIMMMLEARGKMGRRRMVVMAMVMKIKKKKMLFPLKIQRVRRGIRLFGKLYP